MRILPLSFLLLAASLAVAEPTATPTATQGYRLPADAFAAAPRLDRFPLARLLRDAAVRELDLAPAQRETLRATFATHHAELALRLEASAAAQRQLTAAIKLTPHDDTALQLAADRVGQTRRDLALAAARLRADLRLALTPAQLARIDAWQSLVDTRLSSLAQAFTS